MVVEVGVTEPAVHGPQRRLCVPLFVLSLGFWGLLFTRSILSVDDMGLLVRGRSGLGSLSGVLDMLHHDVFEQNGRIADSTLSLVATMGEPAARAYIAVACSLLFPTALIWLSFLLPSSSKRVLPSYALPLIAACLPFLMFALDRRLISQLVLFGAASSGYFTGLFLVTVGLVPVLRSLNGLSTSRIASACAVVPLLVGVLFHEVLAALLVGAGSALAYVAIRRPRGQPALLFRLTPLVLAVVLKASTPGLWSRAADTDQRQLADASLLARTDTAIAFAVVAFVPLLAYAATSLALSLAGRGATPLHQARWMLMAALLVVLGLGSRVLDGYPVAGVVTVFALALLLAVAAALRRAHAEPVEMVALAAMTMALCVPIFGGVLPGRAWFFGEFFALLVAVSWLVRSVATGGESSVPAPQRTPRMPSGQFLAVALLGSGVVVAPVLAYELADKVNDNYAWRAEVDAEVQGQSDGSVEIPWTYPWDDMRPSFALDADHEAYEDLVRAYFGISDDTELVWNGAVDWTAG